MVVGRGSRNCWTPSAVRPNSQTRRTRRAVAAGGARSVARLATRRAPTWTAATSGEPLGNDPFVRPTAVRIDGHLDATQRFADLDHELEVAPLLACLERPRVWQVDVDHPADPTGPGRHDDDAGRQEHRLRDRVGDEEDRRLGLAPDPHELEVHPLARHLVQRPEWLIHQEELRVECERTGDGDPLLHPSRQLPRVLTGEVVELDQTEEAARAALP